MTNSRFNIILEKNIFSSFFFFFFGLCHSGYKTSNDANILVHTYVPFSIREISCPTIFNLPEKINSQNEFKLRFEKTLVVTFRG